MIKAGKRLKVKGERSTRLHNFMEYALIFLKIELVESLVIANETVGARAPSPLRKSNHKRYSWSLIGKAFRIHVHLFSPQPSLCSFYVEVQP
jgi:hypothetical protein